MKTKKTIAIATLLLITFTALTWGNNANAVTCQDIQSGNVVNGSLKRACDASVRTGALWLSGNNDSEYLWPGASYDTNKGKVTVYLRGAIICGYYCLEQPSNATYVKLVRGSNYIRGASIYNYSNYGAFSSVPLSFSRPEAKRNGGRITASAYPITLDLDKMKELEGNNYTIKNGSRLYQLDIQAYRCMEGTNPSMDSYCDSDTVKLDVSMPLSKYTLSAYAVTTNGENLNNGEAISSKTVEETDTASVTRTSISDYLFKGWATTKENAKKGTYFTTTNTGAAAYLSGSSSPKETYNIKSLTNDSSIYAVYEHKSFQANATVAGSSTTYTSEDNSINKKVTCNDLNNGCSVSFSFNMKRIAGAGATTYSILSKPVGKNKYENVKTNQSFNPSENNSAQQVATYKGNIKPGESLCYRIAFHPYGNYGANITKNITACAYAISNLGSSITMMVKKNNSAKFNHAPDTKPLYVKPTDTVYLQGSYTPKAQYAANLSPKRLVINKTTDETSGTIISRFNKLIEPDWKNAFSIRLKNANNKVIVSGDTKKKNGDFSNYTIDRNSKITKDYVGQTLTAVAQTNISNDYETTPKSAEITYVDGTGFIVKINNSVVSDSDYIKVPYNFSNRTEITDNPDEKKVYAGQDATINYSTVVGTRKNNTIGDNAYATIVRDAKYKMRMTSDGGGSWTYSEEKNGTLHDNDSLESETIPQKARFIIPDVPAGSKICFQSLVYPKDSGNDTNLNSKYYDENNLNNWAFSEEKCFVVAKKPSLQVWGGNIYSSGEIDTSTAAKTIDGNLHTFGSWGELGIISGGAVRGMASGAGYGYSEPNFAAKPGGAKGDNFCDASPLSFANNDCQNKETGSLSISFGGLSNDSDFITQALANENANIRNRYSSFSDFKFNFTSGEIDSGTVFISNPDDDINIDENIKYTGNYTSLDSMPKVVIYAKNVNISCNVSRIDALIIAKQTVDTCSNGGGINSRNRSNQLIINGAIIAKKLEAGRTYGAGAGTDPETGNNYSIVPAEIINFDPSLYLWGGKEVNVDANTSLKNSYVRELSPRY